MYITVLCKVVDNFGDIGVAWRMCRRLSKIQNKFKICLVVDDLVSFSKINPSVDTTKSVQTVEDVEVFLWNDNELCFSEFSKNDGERLEIILECFQCGRPEWMEQILFEQKLTRTVHIIMIDYLTAEKYAEDFHCLKSLTRSARVQKVNFMPGFTECTGGLIIDDEWVELPVYNENGDILVFTYENDWAELAASLNECTAKRKVLVAQGRGKESMLRALRQAQSFDKTQGPQIIELPYMSQTKWDQMMKQCSVLIIRGEESMSRACLSGIPFIWQAYPQSEEYQLVKVRALLERMRPHFPPQDFEVVAKTWLAINGEESFDNAYTNFLLSVPCLVPSFQDFAESLRKNGDLCANLMTFIKKIAIIYE